MHGGARPNKHVDQGKYAAAPAIETAKPCTPPLRRSWIADTEGVSSERTDQHRLIRVALEDTRLDHAYEPRQGEGDEEVDDTDRCQELDRTCGVG
jgi:hypothetical protein